MRFLGESYRNQPSANPVVSIITIVKKGGEAKFLESLRKQKFDMPFEVFVVEGGNRSQARNFAIAHSRAPLTSFIDADCDAPSDWIAHLIRSLPDDETIAGVGGVSSGTDPNSKQDKAVQIVFSTYLGSLNSPSLISFSDAERCYVGAISAHNCLYRRSALIEVGCFDERFALNEDTNLCARLRGEGYKLILDRSSYVRHERRDTASFIRQFFWYGVGRTRTMLTCRKCIDIKILTIFLMIVFLALMAPILPFLAEAALAGYLLTVAAVGFAAAKRNGVILLLPRILLLFLVEHGAYLSGLFAGVFMGRWRKNEMREPMRITRHQPSALETDVTLSENLVEKIQWALRRSC